jgi:hypothetical protein
LFIERSSKEFPRNDWVFIKIHTKICIAYRTAQEFNTQGHNVHNEHVVVLERLQEETHKDEQLLKIIPRKLLTASFDSGAFASFTEFTFSCVGFNQRD